MCLPLCVHACECVNKLTFLHTYRKIIRLLFLNTIISSVQIQSGIFQWVHKFSSLVLWNFIMRFLTSLLLLENLKLKEKKMTGAIYIYKYKPLFVRTKSVWTNLTRGDFGSLNEVLFNFLIFSWWEWPVKFHRATECTASNCWKNCIPTSKTGARLPWRAGNDFIFHSVDG